MKYFSAGPKSDRADFFAQDCFSWCGPSTYQISGWRNLVEVAERATMIPMLLAEYGSNARSPRIFDEVLCLYSPDMTGVYSGGFVYTFIDTASRYGLVKIDGQGRRVKLKDFDTLKERFVSVNYGDAADMAMNNIKPYEQWIGEFPPTNDTWQATSDIPPFPGDWSYMTARILGDGMRS